MLLACSSNETATISSDISANSAENCSDLVDNNGDTKVDCNDPLCFSSAECKLLEVPAEHQEYETVLVEKGSFWMGCLREKDGNCDTDAVPQFKATVSHNFVIMKTEVTQGLYRSITGTSVSRFKNCGLDCPVEKVSWFSAIKFANQLSEREGLTKCYTFGQGGNNWPQWDQKCTGWRLPTEMEWALAARDPEAKSFSKRGNIGQCSGGETCADVAWTSENSQAKTHPVCTKQPNARGLCDMSGNVWEWVWDFFAVYDGTEKSDSRGPETGEENVVRGGSWDDLSKYAHTSSRDYGYNSKHGYDNYGFRLVRTVSKSE